MIPVNLKWAATLGLAAAVFAAGHHYGAAGVQADWDKAKLAQAGQAVAATQAIRAVEQSNTAKQQEAINHAASREITLRRAADRVRNAGDGLRVTADAIRASLPDPAVSAAADAADAFAAVFGECVSRLGALAESADRHASDALTCREAWPESGPESGR